MSVNRYDPNTGQLIKVSNIAVGETLPPPSISLSATFNSDTPAVAEGAIYLESTTSLRDGNYDIMWGDENGVMSNYSKIGTVSLDFNHQRSMDLIKLTEYNAIPKYATRICAVKDNVIVCDYQIPSSKLWAAGNYGEHLYSFGALSDVHVQYQTGHDDVHVSMTYLNEREGVDAICIAGDLTKSGTIAHLEEWKSDRDQWASDTPVYSCVGNHEAYNADAVMYANKTAIREYLDTDWTNETEAYFYKVINNDVFVFLSIFEDTYQGAGRTMFTATELAWLEDIFETYRNQRVFLFAHVPAHWETEGIKYSGFALGNGAYSYDIWGNPYQTNYPKSDRTDFLNLLAHYKNVIWFSGHSHIKYEYQKMWDDLNLIEYKNGVRMVHISSLTVPRDIIDGSTSDYIYAESEGAVVDVYPNCIRVRNRNFVSGKFIGLCEYLVDTTPETIQAKTKTVISISATKTKTAYYTDEALSTADISVTALYSDTTTADVSAVCVFDTSNVNISTAGTYTIGISYTYGEDTVTTSLQVTSELRPAEMIVALDATFTGTLSGVSKAIPNSGITANNSTTSIVDKWAVCHIDAMQNKPLYYRLLSNVGISESEKIGFIGSIGTSTTMETKAATPDYALTSFDWELLTNKNDPTIPFETDETNNYLALYLKSSSKSTATFPVAIDVRIQIGYAET